MSESRIPFERVVVAGCGVIGLTAAITLRERSGRPVKIVARDLPPHTTSNIAAAVWMPFHVAPEAAVVRWSHITREVLESQIADPESGVFPVPLLELTRSADEVPYWMQATGGYRKATRDELPAGYFSGLVVQVPMIDTTVYMPWLMRRFLDSGGTIENSTFDSLEELASNQAGPGDLIVNCTGLGARELCRDDSVFPIRGQIVRLAVKGYARAIVDDHGFEDVAYLLPRRNELIAGGTTEMGHSDKAVDPMKAEKILRRAICLDPGLSGASVTGHLVGLRPGRSAVRLEKEVLSGGRVVIHNYGHGGAGFTLAWGCAQDVAELAAKDGKSSFSPEGRAANGHFSG